MPYAGLWKRFCALFVDLIVLLPLIVLTNWLETLSKPVAYASLVLGFVLGYGYTVACHARWGQTVGKRLLHLRVVQLDGSPIGFQQALLRSFVDILFGLINVAGLCIAFSALSQEQFTLPWLKRAEVISDLCPPWSISFFYLGQAWIVCEAFVLLINPQKRALHDLIAATAVRVIPTTPAAVT